jgi:molybdopterin converting factor small subunit
MEPAADEEIRVGGEPACLDTVLAEGDIVTLVPRIRGG